MKKQKKFITKHHLIPKERTKLKNEGQDLSYLHQQKILMLWREKHTAWHLLFGNLTLKEIIKVLQRIDKLK